MKVRELLEQKGLTPEGLSAILESGGVKTKATTIHGYVRAAREVPPRWLPIVNGQAPSDLDDTDEPPAFEPYDGSPPRMPEGAPHEKAADRLLPILAADVAKERLTELYGLVGFTASKLSGHEGIKVVTDAQAPTLAQAWVKAASEGSEFASRVLRLLSAGGTMGELVQLHIVWLFGILYVSGRIDDPTGLLASKYKGFHDEAVIRNRADDLPTIDGQAPGAGAPAGASTDDLGVPAS